MGLGCPLQRLTMGGLFREPDVLEVVGMLLLEGMGIFGVGRGNGDNRRSWLDAGSMPCEVTV
jgi:hypothetical protein